MWPSLLVSPVSKHTLIQSITVCPPPLSMMIVDIVSSVLLPQDFNCDLLYFADLISYIPASFLPRRQMAEDNG